MLVLGPHLPANLRVMQLNFQRGIYIPGPVNFCSRVSSAAVEGRKCPLTFSKLTGAKSYSFKYKFTRAVGVERSCGKFIWYFLFNVVDDWKLVVNCSSDDWTFFGERWDLDDDTFFQEFFFPIFFQRTSLSLCIFEPLSFFLSLY